MKTIQCAHPPHHHNGFVTTCRLWTASDGVHALLVHASLLHIYIYIYIYIHIIYIYVSYIYILYILDERNVCSFTSETSQSGSRGVSSLDSSALLNISGESQKYISEHNQNAQNDGNRL